MEAVVMALIEGDKQGKAMVMQIYFSYRPVHR